MSKTSSETVTETTEQPINEPAVLDLGTPDFGALMEDDDKKINRCL